VFELLIAEIARARFEERICGIPSPSARTRRRRAAGARAQSQAQSAPPVPASAPVPVSKATVGSPASPR